MFVLFPPAGGEDGKRVGLTQVYVSLSAKILFADFFP